METLEELKAIRDSAPKGSQHITSNGCYVSDGYYNDGFSWLKCEHFTTMRSLSDIERIIELEERLNNSEHKKEECSHPSSTASYTHVTCDSCHMIRTDGGWGCASRKWFDNIESAKFYEKNGFLPR